MHSSVSAHRLLTCCLVLSLTALLSGAVVAQDTPAATLFEDAHSLEVTLRKEIGTYHAGTPSMPLIRRARILVGTYEDIARLFPDSGYGDRALWEGASLAADVFDVFKEASDRAAAIRLTETLDAKYPSSALLAQAHRRIGILALPSVPASPVVPAESSASAAKPVGASPAPRSSAVTPGASSITMLQSIKREVLPDVLRVSLELDREVAFHEERLDGPARVFVDLPNTRAAADIQDARLAFDSDFVRQIRVGRQLDRRIRVVLDLSNAPTHSIYTLYNPFRIVIDFERPATSLAAHGQVKLAAVSPAHPQDLLVAKPPVLAVARPPVAASPKTSYLPSVKLPVAKVALLRPPVVTANNAQPTVKREPVLSASSMPAKTAGGLSISRQLGLGVSRVVIDPGHGGHDPGAKQDDITESELVLDVAFRLELLLQKENIEVVLTRRSNVFVPLEERPAIALREEADLYLSIHANASADRTVRGVETYILNFAPNAQSAAVAARENMGSARTMKNLPDILRAIALNNKIDESRDLARQVQASLVERLSKGNRTVRNLGVKQAPFVVLVGTDMPSMLAEIGFITNKQDAALVKTAVYRQQIAEALASGILRYQKRLKPSQIADARR